MKHYILNNIQDLTELRDRGALFVVNHSGGKDSQAMQILIEQLVPSNQILTVHSDLVGADWAGCWDHIQATVKNDTRKTMAVWKKSGPHKGAVKTFMAMVDDRQMWPSPTIRQCTSDLKRTPIEKTVRHYIKQHNLSGLVVNCMGIREQEGKINKKGEATGRAMGLDKDHYKETGTAITLTRDMGNSLAGREYYQAYPIFKMTLDQVWQTIMNANQQPHPVYAKGMTRLSCMFCVMASKNDLTIAAKLVPHVYKEYCEKELEINFTFAMPDKKHGKQFLPEITGIDPYNNPGPDGTEQQDQAEYDDLDCGGWERSRDEVQMDLFN